MPGPDDAQVVVGAGDELLIARHAGVAQQLQPERLGQPVLAAIEVQDASRPARSGGLPPIRREKSNSDDDDDRREDDCESFQAGPSFVRLTLAGGSDVVVSEEVPAGQYDRLKFEVDDLDDDSGSDRDLLAAIRAQVSDWPEAGLLPAFDRALTHRLVDFRFEMEQGFRRPRLDD